MKTSLLIFCALLIAGCATPIKTKVNYGLTAQGTPQLNYSSEKDVLYSRTTISADGSTEEVEFKALASAAALAQAEREAAQAQALQSAVEALTDLAKQAAPVVAPTIIP